MCRTHRLFNALIYVYTLALDDYITPLDDMCKAMLGARASYSPAVATEIGYKYGDTHAMH